MSPLRYERRVEIITVGFEGPNRAGKGTQCALLQDWLARYGLPSLVVRGDGSRPGRGHWPGDPESDWWQQVNTWLRTSQATHQDWDEAAYRLARELLVWRDRELPRQVREVGGTLGVLLVDRSLLSRTMIPRSMGVEDVADRLYPESGRHGRQGITADQVCPDVILNLVAPKEVLLARLASQDPKAGFRRRLIEATGDWFQDAADYLPERLRSRVVHVDATREAGMVSGEVLDFLKARFEPIRIVAERHRCSPGAGLNRCF